MAKKAKAAPSARPVPSPSGLAPSPAPRKPPQPLQLPLARYFSCRVPLVIYAPKTDERHRLVSLQLSLVPLCLFVLPRALRTGVPLVFTAAIRPLVADPVAALSWACLGLFALQVQVGWRLYTWRVEGVAGTTLTENPVKVRPYEIRSRRWAAEARIARGIGHCHSRRRFGRYARPPRPPRCTFSPVRASHSSGAAETD
jgi:hypothetical protein